MKIIRTLSLVIMAGLGLLNGCKKKSDDLPAPTVSTPLVGVSNVTTPAAENSAGIGGTVDTNGGNAITQYGHVYSETNKLPTLTDSKTELGTLTGPFPATFTSTLNGLKASTIYYVRAYATNNAGTGYGAVVEFKTASVPPPAITSFLPGRGSAGDQIVINGTNFNPVLNSNVVKFNGKPAKVIAGNITTLTVEIPEKAGIGPLTVETNGQTATSGRVFNFYYSAKAEKVAGGFGYPQNITIDGKGIIYVPDRQSGQIRRINTNGTVSVIAGSTPADINSYKYNVRGSDARFVAITGLAVDANGENLYAVDERTASGFLGGVILKIDLTTPNYFVQQLGTGQTGHPTSIRLDEVNKKLFINYFSTTTLAGRVATMNTDGTGLTTIIGSSTEAGFNPTGAGDVDGPTARLRAPAGSFLSKDGQWYYLAEEHNHAIRLYSVAAKKVKTLTGTGIADPKRDVYPEDFPISNTEMVFNQPTGIAVDSEGRIYVTEWNNRKALWVYDPKSLKWQVLLNQLRSPYGLTINNKDELFFSEWTGTNDSVIKVTVK